MVGKVEYYKDCQGKPSVPDVECPPHNLIYDEPPPDPIDILFIGWNPPGANHFWNDKNDNLRKNLWRVLNKLGWNIAEEDFLDEFRRQKCYLVHAVKCWRRAEFPSERSKKEILTRTCARALLKEDIRHLRPNTLCILGKIPHIAAEAAIPGFPKIEKAGYRKGWCEEVSGMKVIITCFPHRGNEKYTVQALREWLPKD